MISAKQGFNHDQLADLLVQLILLLYSTNHIPLKFQDSDDADDPEQQSDSSAASSGISLSCSATGVQLPPCTLQHLADLDQAIQAAMYSPGEREKMAQALQYNK